MGTLRLVAKDHGDAAWTETGWSRTGQQHTSAAAAWGTATVTLESPKDRVAFESVKGSSYTSDAAFDDVAIVCASSKPFDFNSGLPAGWSHAASTEARPFTQRVGSTPSSNTGPNTATGNYYWYSEASGPPTGQLYRLEYDGRDCPAPGIRTVEFKYHM